jgi:hypothetical protein
MGHLADRMQKPGRDQPLFVVTMRCVLRDMEHANNPRQPSEDFSGCQ